MISVDIRDKQKICSLNHAAIRTFLKEAIRLLLPGDSCRLSLVLSEDSEIARLNARYLGKDRPTDVLAFSMKEGRVLKGDLALLGDVMISTETAQRNARRFGVCLETELALYLVHGLLHLLGYEDKTPSQRRKMRAKEQRVLEHCKGKIPLKRLVTS